MENKIYGAQLRAWILTATVPAILSAIGRNGWLTALVTGLVCATITSVLLSGSEKEYPKWLYAIELVWAIFFLGGVAKTSAACWADAETPMGIPVILLALAAFASYRGPLHSARVGATLAWLVLPILGFVALSGTMDFHVDWIRMKLEVPDGMLVGLLMVPSLGIFVPRKCSKIRWVGVVLCVVAVAGALLADGTMGIATAEIVPNTFYEFSKGITLFGVAERFEAVVACVITAGWLALFALILSVITQLTKKVFYPAGQCSAWGGAAVATGLMFILPNNGCWMAVGALIFWGFLPALTQVVGHVKNLEKNKKCT